MAPPPDLALDATESAIPGLLSVTELTADDFAKHLEFGARHNYASLQTIKTAHHQVAILMAKGRRYVEIARLTGYSPQTIGTLRHSPAFMELVRHYEVEEEARISSLQTRTETVSHQALDEIQERLENPDEARKIPLTLLTDLATKMLDRAGQGPVKKSESKNVTVFVGAEQVKRIREEAALVRFVPSQASSANRRPALGEGSPRRPLAEGGSDEDEPVAAARAGL